MCHSPSCLYHCSEGRLIKMPCDSVELPQFCTCSFIPLTRALLNALCQNLAIWSKGIHHRALRVVVQNTAQIYKKKQRACIDGEAWGLFVFKEHLESRWGGARWVTAPAILALGYLQRKKRGSAVRPLLKHRKLTGQILPRSPLDSTLLRPASSPNAMQVLQRELPGPELVTCAGSSWVPREWNLWN